MYMSEPHPDTMDWRDAAYLDTLPLRVGDAEREVRRVLAATEGPTAHSWLKPPGCSREANPTGVRYLRMLARGGDPVYRGLYAALAEALAAAVADGGLLDRLAGGAR